MQGKELRFERWGLLREVGGEDRNLKFGDGNATKPGLFVERPVVTHTSGALSMGVVGSLVIHYLGYM